MEKIMMTFLVLTTIATVLSVIFAIYLLFKNRTLYKKLKYVDEANMWHRLAITDDLTGVYNRNAFNNKMIRMKEKYAKKTYTIILFDVDDFKMINDTKGHLTGDKVLQNVAKILKRIFDEPGYKVFRIGGDEFSVVAENISENEIVEKLLLLKEHLKNNDIQLSKGYSLVQHDVYEAFKCADEMLYSDKLFKKEHLHL